MRITNTAEGGTNGTNVTTGNSGGTSGDAFDAVNRGTGATVAYDNTYSAHGGLAYAIATGGTASAADIEWTTSGGSLSTVYGRFYFYATAAPATQHRVLTIATSGGAALNTAIYWSTSQTLLMTDSSATAILTSSTLATNTWHRVEFKVIQSATVGQLELKVFSGTNFDGTTADYAGSSSATQNTGSAAMALYSFGSGFDVKSNITTVWLDDIGLSDTGYLGSAPYPAQYIRWASALGESSPITFPSSGSTAPQAGDVIVIMGSRDDVMMSQKEWDLGSLSLALSTLYVTATSWVQFGAMYSAPLTAAEATALAGGTVTMQSSDDYAYVVALLAGSDGTLDGVANINSTASTGATSLSVTGTTTTDDNEIEFAHFDVGANSSAQFSGPWGTPTGFTVLGTGVTNVYHALSGFYKSQSSAGATGTITASMAPGGPGQVAAAFAGAFAFRNTYISDGTTPTVRSWVNFAPGNAGSVTIDRPDGIIDGDTLVLIVAGDGAGKVGSFTLPSGFTIVDQTYTSGSSWGSTNPLLFVATKTASGEPTTYSLTTDAASDVVGTLMAVRDTNGLDTHSTLLNYEGTIGDGSVATQAISTSAANCLVVSAYTAKAGPGIGLGMTGPSGNKIYARGIGSHEYAAVSLGVFGTLESSTVSSKTYTATLDYDSDGFAPTAIALAFKPVGGGGGWSTSAITAWLRA